MRPGSKLGWLLFVGPLTWIGFALWVLIAYVGIKYRGRLMAIHPLTPTAMFGVGLAVAITLFYLDPEVPHGRYALPLGGLAWAFFTVEYHFVFLKWGDY